MEGAGDCGRATTVHEVAIQAADPVLKVRTAAHALCVCEEGERGGAVGEACGFDVCYFLAGGDNRRRDVWEAD
jgi:hypothetical protein